ncbi:MAG: vitamin K epoxide reductase family protein [Bacteroidia bacterium]|nr:vitamin K epoxide reductase family protein [Bacteroidia bacterium]
MQVTNYLIPLLTEYLKYSDIHPEREELQLALESSPSFPSVLSIIQTCTYFGLNAKAYKADFDALLKSEMPIIVHIKKGSDERFVLVVKATDKQVVYKDATTFKTVEVSTDEFSKEWTRILILSEKNKEKRPKRRFFVKKYSIYSLFLLAVIMTICYNPQSITFYISGLLLLKSVGAWLAYHLIRHEKGLSYSLFDNFCQVKASFDCNKVLASKASKIFNRVSLADSGFVYFATGVTTIVLGVFSGLQNSTLLMLLYASVCGIPLVVFSVLYQKIVVKKWCIFCLSVAGIIFLEVFLFLFIPKGALAFDYIRTFLLLFFSLIVGLLTLYFFKRLLQKQTEAFANRVENLRIKRNPFILATIFNKQQQAIIPENNQIYIGNKQAPIVITTLLNPMCRPCSNIVKNMLILLEKCPQKLLWKIRFDGVESKEYQPINRIQLHLMQLCNNENNDSVKLQIIKDWYRKQSIGWFINKYPIKEILEETVLSFAMQNTENKQLDVKKIPTLWINNKEFPQEYSVEDIPFLLTDINFILQLVK